MELEDEDGIAAERIKELEKQRAKELEARRWMASCPDRHNSFGRQELFEKQTNEQYDRYIGNVRRNAEAPNNASAVSVSPNHNSRSSKRRKMESCRSRGRGKGSDGHSCSRFSGGGDASISNKTDLSSGASSSDHSNSDASYRGYGDVESSEDEYQPSRRKRQNNTQEVIEIDDSSGSELDSSCDGSDESNNDMDADNNIDQEGDGSSENASNDNGTPSSDEESQNESQLEQHSDAFYGDDKSQSEPSSGNNITNAESQDDHYPDATNGDGSGEINHEYESDEEDSDEEVELERFHASRIKQSKLTMAMQGFRSKANLPTIPSSNRVRECDDGGSVRQRDYVPFDPPSLEHSSGRTFHKNKCYITVINEGDVTVGIRRFVSKGTAECVLIRKFEDTLLGQDDEPEYDADDNLRGTHVQIYKEEVVLPLSSLERESEDVHEIPGLIYQAQTPGDWHTFGYFTDRRQMRTTGMAKCPPRSLDLFAGAGGSLLGYKNSGFDTVLAVENDTDAAKTLRRNNKGLKVYEGCIKQFIKDYDVLKCAIDPPDHIHFSSPCQDFSQANRSLNGFQASGKRERADLSLLLADIIEKTSCQTAVFENVVGIWQRKNIHYLKTISAELMKLGYQVRCTVLRACDYGDPQIRPRFLMFIAKDNVPMPSFPSKTHGLEKDLWPYVTVKDALSPLANNDFCTNTGGRKSQLRPGQHGVIRLMPHGAAPTVRANGPKPFHYEEERSINVREAAALQSFPNWYHFEGNLSSQYKQVGNAVPVGLATAVAQCFKQVLIYEYGVFV